MCLPLVLWCCWLGLLTCKTHYRVGEPTAAWQFVDIVSIDCLTMVDNTSAVGNDSRPWVVPQLINGCQLPQGRDGSLQNQSLVEFLISSGPLCPPYRQCLMGSSWQQQQVGVYHSAVAFAIVIVRQNHLHSASLRALDAVTPVSWHIWWTQVESGLQLRFQCAHDLIPSLACMHVFRIWFASAIVELERAWRHVQIGPAFFSWQC